jgi:hypothetical protein
MAKQIMTVQTFAKAGIADLMAGGTLGNALDVGQGFAFANDGKTILLCSIATGSASNETVTFTAVNDEDGRTETLAPVIVKGKIAVYGPFPPALWNDGNGMVNAALTQKQVGDSYTAIKMPY